MINDADYFIRQSEAILAMAKRLAPFKIAIYELNLSDCFGSWVLVAGKRKERVKFVWDGRDYLLRIVAKDLGLASSEEALEQVEKFLMQKFEV